MQTKQFPTESGLKPYPNYKPSGIPWLGDVPKHWENRRLGVLCQLNPSKSQVSKLPMDLEVGFIPMELLGENGELNTAEVRKLGEVYQGFTYCKDGDVIVAKITPCFENGKGALCIGLSNGIGMGTTELHVLRPEKINGKYLYWITRQRGFREIGATEMRGSAGQQRVPIEFIKNWIVGLPSSDEQKIIAVFLDQTTAKLDELIAQKQRLIELLKEKRQALITKAVTKGLNPNVKMKDSGVPWLGQIPEHWGVKRLKLIASKIGSGKTPKGGAEIYSESGIVFLRSQNIYDEGLRLDDVVYIEEKIDNDMKSTRVKPLDVLLNITGASIGRSCIWPESEKIPANVNQHVCIIRCIDIDNADFVSWFLKSSLLKAQIDVLQEGGNREGLSAENAGNLLISLPLIEEQKGIVKYLRRKTKELDSVIELLIKQIDIFQEQRTSLTSAAVTGCSVHKISSDSFGSSLRGFPPRVLSTRPNSSNVS